MKGRLRTIIYPLAPWHPDPSEASGEEGSQRHPQPTSPEPLRRSRGCKSAHTLIFLLLLLSLFTKLRQGQIFPSSLSLALGSPLGITPASSSPTSTLLPSARSLSKSELPTAGQLNANAPKSSSWCEEARALVSCLALWERYRSYRHYLQPLRPAELSVNVLPRWAVPLFHSMRNTYKELPDFAFGYPSLAYCNARWRENQIPRLLWLF